MKRDMNDLKKLVLQIMESDIGDVRFSKENNHLVNRLFHDNIENFSGKNSINDNVQIKTEKNDEILDTEELIEESLSLQSNENELIRKALEKYHGKRKLAAKELGISERTLYRKIREYGIL